MHAFSRSLANLYEIAEQAPFDEFPAQVLRLLRQWVGFDGAVLGVGETSANAGSDLQITQAHVQDRDAGILQAYGRVSAADPVTRAFVAGLASPLAVDCQALYRARHVPELGDFSRAYGLRHLMLFGDEPAAGDLARWLVLYRSDDMRFGIPETQYLHAAWFHISHAIRLNRRALLDREDLARTQRASALADASGRIEAADRQFLALLRRQWPHFQGTHLPRELLGNPAGDFVYRGKDIEVSLKRRRAFIVCTASSAEPLAQLTTGENAVARRFAAGMSHKQIARELGLSPHTVRSHIAHAYAKLNVHDKAALAQHLMGHGGGRRLP